MQPAPPIYHPFSKPGGGAPRKDPDGKIATQMRGYMAGEVNIVVIFSLFFRILISIHIIQCNDHSVN